MDVNKWMSYEYSDDVKLYSIHISQQITTLLYIKRACELNKSHIISTDEDPGLRIESFAVINLRGVSTNKTIIYFIAMQTYKELILNTFTIHLLVHIHQKMNCKCKHEENCKCKHAFMVSPNEWPPIMVDSEVGCWRVAMSGCTFRTLLAQWSHCLACFPTAYTFKMLARFLFPRCACYDY
jgi:hypothetical protein